MVDLRARAGCSERQVTCAHCNVNAHTCVHILQYFIRVATMVAQCNPMSNRKPLPSGTCGGYGRAVSGRALPARATQSLRARQRPDNLQATAPRSAKESRKYYTFYSTLTLSTVGNLGRSTNCCTSRRRGATVVRNVIEKPLLENQTARSVSNSVAGAIFLPDNSCPLLNDKGAEVCVAAGVSLFGHRACLNHKWH